MNSESYLHVGNPHPVYSTRSASSPYDMSSSSADIQGVFSDTWMTPMAESSKGPMIRHSESPNESSGQPVRGKNWQRTAIDMLPEDTLLEIFDLYRLDAMKRSRRLLPRWKWHLLAHVCRKWRHVISMSPRRLELRILCESKAPIESILDSWTTFPLVVRHNGPKSKSLPNNVTVTLRRPFRICEIDLVLPSSLIESIVDVIQGPLQALERIRITVKNATKLVMLVHEAFLGGSAPHLREIKLDGIAFPFPAIRQVLLSTDNLVELHLPNIPHDVYFSPEDLVAGLTTSVQLKRLTIGFDSPSSSPPSSLKRPPPQRTTLPSLTFLDFNGARKYLEEFVARIDSPVLRKIKIRLFKKRFFKIPQFCQFIPGLKALGPLTRVIVTHSAESIRVLFEKTRSSNESILLETSCRRLDRQLSFVTRIASQLSPFLSGVDFLEFKRSYRFPTGGEVHPARWLELFQPFTHVTEVDVRQRRLVPVIVQALVMGDMAAGVLPELTKLHLSGYRKSPSVAKDAERFVATRKVSGRTVVLTG